MEQIIEKDGKKYKVIEVIEDDFMNEYKKWEDEKYCLEAVEEYGYALKYVKEQNEAICLEAVKENGYALQYVKEQTETICLEAVKKRMDQFDVNKLKGFGFDENGHYFFIDNTKDLKENICSCCGGSVSEGLSETKTLLCKDCL